MDGLFKAVLTAGKASLVMVAARQGCHRLAGVVATLPTVTAPTLAWLAHEERWRSPSAPRWAASPLAECWRLSHSATREPLDTAAPPSRWHAGRVARSRWLTGALEKVAVTTTRQRPAKMRISHVTAIAALIGTTLSVSAQESFTTPFGGSGGQQFIARCPANSLVNGVEARTGAYVNYIAPLCDGRAIHGGGGGGDRRSAVCPAGSVVRSIAVTSLRSSNHLLKALILDCAARGSQTRTASVPLDTPGAFTSPTGTLGNIALFATGPVGALRMVENINKNYPKGMLSCGAKDIIGLQGRAGAAVDAVGLICR